MTHRHKNQTDDMEIVDFARHMMGEDGSSYEDAEIYTMLQKFRFHRRISGNSSNRSTTPTDSNHGSRTDSTSKGGRA